MTAQPPPIVFSGTSVRAVEINGHLRLIALPSKHVITALLPWRLIDAEAQQQSLILRGVYTGLEGDPMTRTLGPFASEDVARLAEALRKQYALPRVLERVAPDVLEASPRDHHLRHVEVEGDWSSGFELSSFAGAWLEVPSSILAHPRTPMNRRVLVRGIFLCDGELGYGHLEGWAASLVAYRVRNA